jgi:pilus assembly protein FimV
MPFSYRPRALPFHPNKLRAAVALALLVSQAGIAHAMGLGNLTVHSALGQPLQAEIELVRTTGDQEGALTPRIAGYDAYRQANIEFNPVLSSLRFAIETRGERRLIRVTSSQPINEPFVDLLLELHSPDGRLMREYVFLLDPPNPAMQSVAAPVIPAAPAAPVTLTLPGRAAGSASKLPDAVQGQQDPPPAKAPSSAPATEQPARKKPAQQGAANRPRLNLTDVSVAPGSSAVFTAEENAAMEKAVLEANARVKALEQKVEALQQLLTATNGLLTEMHKQNGAGKPADAAAASPVAVASAAAAAGATPAAMASGSASDMTVQAAPAVLAAAEPVKTAALPLKTSASLSPRPAADMAPPPSLLNGVMLPTIAGGGALILGGIAALFLRRRKSSALSDSSTLDATDLNTGSLAPLTEAGSSMFMPTFRNSAAPTLGSDDPVAEADVYIAYGRDMQAEDLLKDALRSKANSVPIRLKLLAIYASRNDKENFRIIATELFEMTRGEGVEWQEAASMGLMIDPVNPLYATAVPALATEPDGEHVMEFETASFASAVPEAPAAPHDALMDLDFATNTAPLEFAAHAAGSPAEPVVPATEALADLESGHETPAPGTGPIDFEFDAPVALPAASPAEDLPELPALAMTEEPAPAPGTGPIDFDFDLPEIPALPGVIDGGDAKASAREDAADASAASLDLDDFLKEFELGPAPSAKR